MPDKKVVDDYYSQNIQEENKEKKLNKKPKISIKWKLKIKKDSEETSPLKEKGAFDSEKKEWEKKVEKKWYITKKTQAERNNKQTERNNKNEKWSDGNNSKFEKKDVKSKNVNLKKIEEEVVTQKDSADVIVEDKKTFWKPIKAWFVAWKKKTKKDFWDNDEKNKKFFKKDKKSKYAKNAIFLDDDEMTFTRSNKIKQVKREEKNVEDIKQNLVDRTWETVVLWDILTLKEFSEKIWIPIPKLIAEFMKNGMKVTLNSKIDYDTASIIADAFQIKLQKDTSSWFSVEDLLEWNIQNLLVEEDTSKLQERPAVISIMWHVDHWKTSLLDYIRKTKVADKEAGWITQSIWAYQVDYNNKKITFLDTPGHEAFTIMRARWAKSTDIAILVVAADEWVKPQTIESINHAREAWIPIVVAMNKIDKEWANIENLKTQLSMQGLQPEDWGWDIPMVWVSAKTWQWIDDLLEIILIVSEMLELKANPERAAVWTVLESHLDVKLWPVSTVLVNTWTLNKWDCVVCKWCYGRVKILKDHVGKNVQNATLSEPVLLVWLDWVTEGWDIVQVVSDIEKARVKALEYKELMSSKQALSSSSIDMIMSKIKSWNLKQLKVVVKSDTNWSLEAIKWSIIKLSTPETKVTIIHSWVWNITEWDVLMCQWSSAILVWYNVSLLWTSKNLVDEKKIEYIWSKIIYHITERIEKIVTWMLDPKEVEVELWEAKVGGIFYEWDKFTIIWLQLLNQSKITQNSSIRIIRWDKIIWKWVVENLKSWIMDVWELEWPTECWIKLKSDTKIELWDKLEIYKIEIHK